MILILPPRWLLIFADQNSHEPTPITVETRNGTKIADTTTHASQVAQNASTARLKEYLRKVFTSYGIEDQIPTAEKIIACESSWNILAHNGTISYGLLEYTPNTWHDFGHGDIMNPLVQIEVTAKIVKREGWERWDCFTGKR